MQDILRFTRQTAADDRQLPADPAKLGLLPVEGFAQLEIPVADFQETDRFQIHRARCTGTKAFCNGGPRNHWVWVQTGGEANYAVLRGWVIARLLARFKISNISVRRELSIGWDWFTYSIQSIVADFTLRADIFESASGLIVVTWE